MADAPTIRLPAGRLHAGEHAHPTSAPGAVPAGLHADDHDDPTGARPLHAQAVPPHEHRRAPPRRPVDALPHRTPLASSGGARLARTALAVALLWVAVAWALGWFGL